MPWGGVGRRTRQGNREQMGGFPGTDSRLPFQVRQQAPLAGGVSRDHHRPPIVIGLLHERNGVVVLGGGGRIIVIVQVAGPDAHVDPGRWGAAFEEDEKVDPVGANRLEAREDSDAGLLRVGDQPGGRVDLVVVGDRNHLHLVLLAGFDQGGVVGRFVGERAPLAVIGEIAIGVDLQSAAHPTGAPTSIHRLGSPSEIGVVARGRRH